MAGIVYGQNGAGQRILGIKAIELSVECGVDHRGGWMGSSESIRSSRKREAAHIAQFAALPNKMVDHQPS